MRVSAAGDFTQLASPLTPILVSYTNPQLWSPAVQLSESTDAREAWRVRHKNLYITTQTTPEIRLPGPGATHHSTKSDVHKLIQCHELCVPVSPIPQEGAQQDWPVDTADDSLHLHRFTPNLRLEAPHVSLRFVFVRMGGLYDQVASEQRLSTLQRQSVSHVTRYPACCRKHRQDHLVAVARKQRVRIVAVDVVLQQGLHRAAARRRAADATSIQQLLCEEGPNLVEPP
mmetsp:Transcript_149894/g.276511  ORF Transcript_149894/g.276511 Transcript_149894/m.276511 type:complete len:229 (+) Transcript_149894:124-810(+)